MKKKLEKNTYNMRMRMVFWGVSFVGFVLIANLFYIQVRNGVEFRARADGQYVASGKNIFERGGILFTQKDGTEVSAAGQKKGYKIAINPQTIKNPEAVYTLLGDSMNMSKESFMKKASHEKRTYVEVAHQIPKKIGEEYKKELGKDIQIYPELWRVYPLKGSAAHTLGFLGYKGDDYAGRYGLERTYEGTLKREDKSLYSNFFARVFHDVQNLVGSDFEKEGDVVTHIDPQVQLFFERELEKTKDKWNSKSIGGIIMNPKTGAVQAIGAYPNFDNNDYSQEKLATLSNPLVESIYEMGSIIKPFVVAAGLDLGVISANTEYYDKGFVKVGPHTISNFDKKGRGWVTVQDVLNQSLNTGMVYITDKIEKQDFRDYFQAYGFGEKTGIDLPNEGRGLTSNLKSNRDIEFANISFGQGLAVTPISVVKALSVLANDGVAVDPHVVKRIDYTTGFSKDLVPDYKDRESVIKPETSEEITRMLVKVFDNYNNGDTKFNTHSVAAKTGTAQIPDPTGGYYGDRNLHSFFGYFPAYDPEFIVFMYTVHPKGVKYASQTLINPFKEVAKYLINYYEVPPDRDIK